MALNWFEKQVAARENDNANIARESRRDNLMAAEQEALEKQGDAFAAARNRRLNSVMDIALRDPGRYAPSVHRAAVEWDRQNQAAGLRAHEMRMLRQQGENEFKVAEQKRLGMREQGADAAGHNAEATKYGWDKQLEVEQERQKGLTEREKIIGERTERIAGMEHGTIGPDGKVTPGSRERVATITGQSAVQQQAEANKGLAAQAEINRQKQQEQIAAQIQRSIIAAGGKADAAKIAGHAKIVGEALRNGSIVGKDAATVMAELAEQYKNDPEMLASIQGYGGQQQPAPTAGSAPKDGDRRQTASGMAVFRNGKWVLETK